MPGTVRTRIEGPIGWIEFDHPERRNALSANMWGELAQAASRFDADPAIRVVVMRGAGEQAFVSGADLSQFAGQPGAETSAGLARGGGNAFAELEGMSKPLLAMIHGHCVGGGLAVAICADMRYAADDAGFAIPAARLGVGYDLAGVEALARLIGISATKELLMSARRYDAAEALALGLVNRVLPKAELESGVREMALRIAGNAPLTVRSIKLIARALGQERASRDVVAIRHAIAACFESEDFAEGVNAFMEKRTPEFRGR